jgi:hypothetical protein
VTVEAHIQATLQHLRDDGWDIKELDYTFPTRCLLTLVAADSPSRQTTLPAANLPPSRVKQGKFYSWLIKAKVPPILVDSDNEDGSTLQQPTTPRLSTPTRRPPWPYRYHRRVSGFLSLVKPNYGWRLFDHVLRVETEYRFDKENTKPFEEWIPTPKVILSLPHKNFKWGRVCVDEAQCLRNMHSSNSHIIRLLPH